MCTLAVAFQHVKGAPLVIAANRDERLDRPAEPPRRWPGKHFVAPRDLAAGGTWLGLTDRGLFVAITNRFGVPRDDSRRSRGELVVEALHAKDARELHRSLETLGVDQFNAFHLFYADREAAFVTWFDGEDMQRDELGPGVHVVTERSLGASDAGRTEAILARWRVMGRDTLDIEALEAMMRRHGEKSPAEGTCIHVPELGYGTRSSMLLIGEDRTTCMFWAEGPPCVTEYREVALDNEGAPSVR